jgi:hypothetical protein
MQSNRRARPCNVCENVAYLPPRDATRHSPRSIGLINEQDVNTAILNLKFETAFAVAFDFVAK